MSNYRASLMKLIQPIFNTSWKEVIPATESQLTEFSRLAHNKGVPEKTILELVEFYRITNGIPCVDSLEIHQIDDSILFERWEERELWIGQRDFYMIRFKDNKYHLGDASNLNYGDEYVSESLIGILQIGLNNWYTDDDI
ncbi:MAG: hypothetical protein Aureis2KO_08460 [Aureisphaera sp.]